jgi:hypothetical protein
MWLIDHTNPFNITVILIFIAIIFHNFIRHSDRTKLKRAPRPFPLCPLLGNLPFLHKLPHQDLYNLLKIYGDVMELKLGSIHTLIISSSRLAKHVSKTHDQAFSFRSLPMNASKHGSDEEISSLMHDVFEDCKVICFKFSR